MIITDDAHGYAWMETPHGSSPLRFVWICTCVYIFFCFLFFLGVSCSGITCLTCVYMETWLYTIFIWAASSVLNYISNHVKLRPCSSTARTIKQMKCWWKWRDWIYDYRIVIGQLMLKIEYWLNQISLSCRFP